ncbi:endolytic transglycosylase MltG [Saccharibacter sp. 17.LH.SD]|uniref:endolytic transglycosylase MltG n=1 Tax=Saccharibacter sp. 17.LH.SD TaxID=2689393 RepID=UPI00136AA20F|nr:endolytic transglycosylase MltG [Saccharibacter sp. 17.LH.SD]MXV44480.1 endolytic transglycosylase MltG [Saccharibacter sp. 17.LH.SD]
MTDASSSESQKKADSGLEEGGSSSPKKWWHYITPGRALAGALAFVAALGGAGYGPFTDPGPLTKGRNIVIPRGGTEQVTRLLQKEGLLAEGWSSTWFFRLSALITAHQGGIHAAELYFPARASVAHILQILRHGHPVSHSLTIAEGLTAVRIRAELQNAPALKGDVPAVEEGSVYPQTVFYLWGMERQALLHKLQTLMATSLERVWAQRDQNALQGIIKTPQQLLILASLIERETSIVEERPRIARVFLNRLKNNMRLQTDPTVIYALSGGQGVLDHPLTHDDLETDSPYNTYEHTGLPPGAICSPGLASLEAAAHPTAGDELYFVATGRGGHAFSKTLSGQAEHVRSYRRQQIQSP